MQPTKNSRLNARKCSSLEREMLTLSNDFAILTEAFEKSQTELTMRDENLAALAKELELSLALNSNEDAAARRRITLIDYRQEEVQEKRENRTFIGR